MLSEQGSRMTPLILELATKAGLYVDVNGKPWPRNMNGEDIEGAYQKFAELIVLECAEISGGNLGPTDRYHTARKIKEHFEIKLDI